MSSTSKTQVVSADGRDRRWDEHRQARRERLLETAIDLIDTDGVDVKVATIASAAEVPRSVVYKLFRDREDLDEQIRGRLVDQINATLWAGLEATDSIQRLVQSAVETYVGWVIAHPNLHRFLGARSVSGPARDSAASRGGKDDFAARARVLIELAWTQVGGHGQVPASVAENVAYGVVGLVDNVVNRTLSPGRGSDSADERIDFLVEAVCRIIEVGGQVAGVAIDVSAPVRLTVPPAIETPGS